MIREETMTGIEIEATEAGTRDVGKKARGEGEMTADFDGFSLA